MLKLPDTGKQLHVVILDFSKAFDKVPHRRLLGKLDFYRLYGNVLTWAEAFLIGRNQLVLKDGIRPEKVDVRSRVPYGTVLGPLIFLFYINDLSRPPCWRGSALQLPFVCRWLLSVLTSGVHRKPSPTAASRCWLMSVVDASNPFVGKLDRDHMASSSQKLSITLHLPVGNSCWFE